MSSLPETLEVIDSHTGGEPTRVIVSGGPDLGHGSMLERMAVLRDQFDEIRHAVLDEPRGNEILVGALLCEPVNPACTAGVIFFNNSGYLNMCGHGTIGLAVTLGYLGRISKGLHRLETVVGEVSFDYQGGPSVVIENVPSYRYRKSVAIEVEGFGKVSGDIAWGGNWFFMVEREPEEVVPEKAKWLSEFARAVRRALEKEGVTGKNGAVIDHVEFAAPSEISGIDSRNFVFCPGLVFDRSPCGTSTSAKVACLIEDGKLKPGEIWRQQGIVGSVFEASGRIEGGRVVPQIRGEAFVSSVSTLRFHPDDPFRKGFTI
jgi:4-hydroxyproline epimerase